MTIPAKIDRNICIDCSRLLTGTKSNKYCSNCKTEYYKVNGEWMHRFKKTSIPK